MKGLNHEAPGTDDVKELNHEAPGTGDKSFKGWSPKLGKFCEIKATLTIKLALGPAK